MKLAPRLSLALGAVVVVATTGLGLALRAQLHARETARFEVEVSRACARVVREVVRQSEVDRRMIGAACASGELVDRTLVALEAKDLDARRPGLALLVPEEAKALDLADLALVTGDGVALGVEPLALASASPSEFASVRAAGAGRFVWTHSAPFGAGTRLFALCTKAHGARSVSLVGARPLAPLLARVGDALDVGVHEGRATDADLRLAHASCSIDDGAARADIVVSRDPAPLEATLVALDATLLTASLASLGIALVVAVVLARSLSRPIAILAQQASRVASGDATPIGDVGSGEVASLASAFDTMLGDLERTRRRLAASTRVAAWREVARRVAHEIRNPLAPIRASVETLRRLRAREDPAFDEVFDDATRTVLSEVHRISDIVTEFTRYARLPPPRPSDVDLATLCREMAALQAAVAAPIRVSAHVDDRVPVIWADRDQLAQLLTNLLQNAVEATRSNGGSEVDVRVTGDADHATIVVCDEGPGVSDAILPRLFEPYATDKPSGTGLGLAISFRIAVEHGGDLAYAPRSPRGSEFRVVLPVSGPAPRSERTAESFS